MAKYTKEEKQKAIDLYIRYCKQATRVIKELGYPNKRHTLVSWYRKYEEKGEEKDDGREAPPPGTKGKVVCVDDIGIIRVHWDNDSSLGVAYGEGRCRVVAE